MRFLLKEEKEATGQLHEHLKHMNNLPGDDLGALAATSFTFSWSYPSKPVDELRTLRNGSRGTKPLLRPNPLGGSEATTTATKKARTRMVNGVIMIRNEGYEQPA